MVRDHRERLLSENNIDIDVGSTSVAQDEHDDVISLHVDITAHATRDFSKSSLTNET